MAMRCNIDARGKRVRLIGGIALLVGALALLGLWALPVGGTAAWVVSLGTLAGAVFVIFEARSGWCALRAMGFRTPI